MGELDYGYGRATGVQRAYLSVVKEAENSKLMMVLRLLSSVGSTTFVTKAFYTNTYFQLVQFLLSDNECPVNTETAQ